MSECIDKRFEKLLAAYELGMLTETELEEYELHLYQCDYCFEKVSRFSKTAELLRYSSNVRKEIIRQTEDGPRTPSTWKKYWPKYVPALIAAVFFLFLIMKDWRFEIQPSMEAFAEENRIAIMYFENAVDPEDSLGYGEIATNLLITDLAESNYLKIVSSQRLYDMLALIGMEGTKSINRDIATQIAKKSDARWILLGSILQLTPNIVITTQLIDVNSGDVYVSQRISGKPGDDIFSVIDKLTVSIKDDLQLPSNALTEQERKIADFTTHSPAAYREYLRGVENYNKLYLTEAARHFENAIKYDSTFAMAYYYLAQLKDGRYLEYAVKYENETSSIDKLCIKILEASHNGDRDLERNLLNEFINLYPEEKKGYYLLGLLAGIQGNHDAAISLMNKAIQLDPVFKMAYNQLAYSYNATGDFAKALWAIDKYIGIAPNEANPYDTKAEIYALNGMLDNAIETYRRALTLKPDFYGSLKNLSLMYMFKGDYRSADSCLDILTTVEDSDYRETARQYKCFIPILQGKFNEAISIIDADISKTEKNPYYYHFIKSLIYMEKEDWTLARKEIEKTIELHDADWPEDKTSFRYFRIRILALGGDLDTAGKELSKFGQIVTKEKWIMYSYWCAAAAVETARGDIEKAKEYYVKANDLNQNYFTNYLLGQICLVTENYEESISKLQKISNEFGAERAVFYAIWSTKLYYYLGVAYDQIGRPDEAKNYLTIFLNTWKDADSGIIEIQDAEKRMARLKNIS